MKAEHQKKLSWAILGSLSLLVVLTLVFQQSDASQPKVTINPKQKLIPVKNQVQKSAEVPKVDVVFVLDTTGSMGSMIAGAKKKIWSIANQVLNGDPRPDVRFGLVAYRDLNDKYITKDFPLSENIDEIQQHLMALKANGGGDGPEHVNKGLHDAIHQMQWRKGQNVLRQIFLVGDAPPHDGRQGIWAKNLVNDAKQAGIIINAIRCGSDYSTQLAWNKFSSNTGGLYASIRHDGGMIAMKTPMDERLKALNEELSKTLLVTGSDSDKKRTRRRLAVNKSLGGFASAESAKYRAKSGKLDSNDLLVQMKRGKKLRDFKKSALPASISALKPAEQEAYVAKVEKRRAKLNKEILELSAKRDRYLKSKKARKKGSFDDVLDGALKAQGKAAGILY